MASRALTLFLVLTASTALGCGGKGGGEGDGTGTGTSDGSGDAGDGDGTGTGTSDGSGDDGDGGTGTGTGTGTGSGGGDGNGCFAWTELVPPADAQMVYVSSSEGDDDNDCLSEQEPCATLRRGEAVLRDGLPDWLLLRRGDEWEEALSDNWSFGWTKSGRSATEPMVITSYGPAGSRPLVKAGEEHGFHRYADTDLHDLALVDLHFRAHTKDPYSSEYVGPQAREFQSGFRFTGGGNVERILVEGCKFEFFGSNFAMHASGGNPLFHDVKIRGNVFYSAWTGNAGDYSQGVYADLIDGLLIEGNVFDRNGGLIGFTDDPNGIIPPGLTEVDVTVQWYNHAAYIQSRNLNVTVRNNVFANGDGMQLRPGGEATNNLFTRTINALTVGSATEPVAGGVTGDLRDNVFLEGTDFSPGSDTPGVRGNGILVANIDPSTGLVIAGNVFGTDMSEDHYGRAVGLDGRDCGSGNAYPCPVSNVTITGNIAHNWRGGFRFDGALGDELDDVTITDNVVQNPLDDQGRIIDLGSGWNPGVFSFSGNRYFRGGGAEWFRVDGTPYDFAGWVGLTSEPGAAEGEESFPDPDRTLAAYNAMLGGDASHEAFMSVAREQSRDTWDPVYEACEVNAWIREGFGQ